MAKEKVKEIDEQAPENAAATEDNTPKKTVLISGAEKWNFDDEPKFTGVYHSPMVAEKDGPVKDGKPSYIKGEILGFNFMDELEEMHIIPNTYSIEKVLQMDYNGAKVKDLGLPLEIEFKGKGTKSDGQQFNRFLISIIE